MMLALKSMMHLFYRHQPLVPGRKFEVHHERPPGKQGTLIGVQAWIPNCLHRFPEEVDLCNGMLMRGAWLNCTSEYRGVHVSMIQ